MNIVFTTQGNWAWDSQLDNRFGRANSFLRFNEEKNQLWWLSNADNNNLDHGAGIQSGQRVIGLKADVLITGGDIGAKAMSVLKQSKIKVYTNVGEKSIQQAYDDFTNGLLEDYKAN